MLSSFVSSAMVMFSLDIDILESSILSLSIPKKEREFIAFNLIFFFDRIILCLCQHEMVHECYQNATDYHLFINSLSTSYL